MKKTFVKGLALAFVGSLVMAGSAMALPFVTMTETQLMQMGDIDGLTNTNFSFGFPWNPPGLGVDFNATIQDANGSGTVDWMIIGADNTTLGLGDLSAFSYELAVTNNNENPWNYGLYLSDGTFTYDGLTASTSIANASSATIAMDLTTVNAGFNWTSYDIGFVVGGDVPLPGNDILMETTVAPIPEPATMLLFGTGLAGLATLRRKKAKK